MKDVLLYPLQNLNEYKEILSYIKESDGAALINGLLPMQKPHIAYSLFKELKKQILFIANSDLEAKKVYEELDGYIKGKVEYLSSQDIHFYHLDAKDRSEEAKKLKTLFKLTKEEKIVVVTSIEAILRKYIPKKVLLDNVITYKIGDIVDIEKLTDTLVKLGYERVSKSYKIYKNQQDTIPRSVFLNVIKGNVGKVIAEEFVSFIEADSKPLISFEDIFEGEILSNQVIEKIKNESHTRLYISAMNILKMLDIRMKDENESDFYMSRFMDFLREYPVDLMVGIMKDIKNSYENVYKKAIDNETFVEAYFEAYSMIRG